MSTLAQLGGVAPLRELIAAGVAHDAILIAAWYERRVIRVRKGWYARMDEPRDVIRAWRVGGRLTCVSALAFHAHEPGGPVLHIEVDAKSRLFRSPDSRPHALSDDHPVVLHWTRYPGPGDRRAVSVEHAERVAERCGTRGAGVPR